MAGYYARNQYWDEYWKNITKEEAIRQYNIYLKLYKRSIYDRLLGRV